MNSPNWIEMKTVVRVMKFGGTSVGDAQSICRAAEIIRNALQRGQIVAVVSAMSGVTNRLLAAAQESQKGSASVSSDLTCSLRKQHHAAIGQLVRGEDRKREVESEIECILRQAEDLCRGTALLRELTPRTLDAISSVGEKLSARIVAASLRELAVEAVAVDATELIITNNWHGQAEPLMEETRQRVNERLLPLLEAGKVPIVTGFIGATMDGTLTTLGRGGSDYSATILGAALNATETVIWTDVDGVMTADPQLVPEARTLNEISYNEAAELAFFGAKVLHPKTLRPVTKARIPVRICNSFAPERQWTKITWSGQPSGSGVKAITAIKDANLITVGGPGMVGVPDVIAKTFAATASVRANILLISQSSSQNDICFVVGSQDTQKTLEALRQAFALNGHNQIEHIEVKCEVAIVAIIGERMRGVPGVAGRIFSAMGREQINIIAIAQGSSEYNISLVIEVKDVARAVATIHREFELHKPAFKCQSEEVLIAEG